MEIYGIENQEVPLVQFDITIPGGQKFDPKGKAGVANLLSDLMMEGTATKTPAELEEAIGLLGANIRISSSNEDFQISGTSLTKNFDATMKLVEEILLQPRWDLSEYNRLKSALETNLKGREADPSSIASLTMYKLLYGTEHNFGVPGSGTLETTANINMEDLKEYYKKLAPENASFHIAGAISEEQVKTALKSLSQSWTTKAVSLPESKIASEGEAGKLYFIDFPEAKQSVILIGKLALSATDGNANKLAFANEILGGGSSGRLFQTLRIGKGYTYGAYSGISENLEVSPFYITSSVRANATLASLKIIEEMVANYAENFGEEEMELTKNKLLKENTRAFESLGAKLGILRDISKYNKSSSFIKDKQEELLNMSLEDFKQVIEDYMEEDEMIYVVVGDKATQLEEVRKLGKEVIELDIYGNPL
jgi:zinc protease